MAVAELEPEILPHPLRREHFDILVSAGAYEDQRVELVEGVVVDMAPQGPEHGYAAGRLASRLLVLLDRRFPDQYEVRSHSPMAATDLSEPEPDVYVINAAASTPQAHPRSAHLVIEVSRTSQLRDLGVKARLYAAAGVPRYWVLDLVARRVVVHTDPVTGDATAATAVYGTVRRLPLDADLDVLGISLELSDLL